MNRDDLYLPNGQLDSFKVFEYINDLENQRDTYSNNYRWLTEKHNNDIRALEKALNKACYFLEQKDLNWLEFYPLETSCLRNDKEWKEWCLRDE